MKASTSPSPQLERQEIGRILQEIGATSTGAEAVAYAQRSRWAVVYGRPVAGGAFTYPYRRIVLMRGLSYSNARSALAHELHHAWRYPCALADSVQQEYEAEAFAVQVHCEMGALSQQERDAWFRVPRETHYARIRHYSAWHYRCLPDEQPAGLLAWWYAAKQFVGLVALRHRRRAPGR